MILKCASTAAFRFRNEGCAVRQENFVLQDAARKPGFGTGKKPRVVRLYLIRARAKEMAVKQLGPTIRQFAKRLRQNYASEITADPWGFKRKAKRLLGLYLPPGPGRPPEPAISKAIELRRQGQEWKQIYPQVIPRHSELDPIQRRYEESNLRSATRSRRNAARRRGRRGEEIPARV